MIIYLDMDGVLCNFVSPVLDMFGKTELDITPGNYLMEKDFGIKADELWAPINAAGREFWSGMKPYDWAEDLVKLCNQYGDVFIATSPSFSPECTAGKMEWLYDFFGSDFRKFIMTPHKHHLAARDRVLIDDSDRKVDKFYLAGGQGILFPQRWNMMHNYDDNKLKFISNSLEYASEGAV